MPRIEYPAGSGGGGGGTPSAPPNSVQFNNGGAFGGSNLLTWNGSTLVFPTSQTGVASKTFADTGYAVAATVETVFWDCSGGNCASSLPTAIGAGGRTITVKRTDASANTLIITAAAGNVEAGAAYIVAGGGGRISVSFRSDNANWWIV